MSATVGTLTIYTNESTAFSTLAFVVVAHALVISVLCPRFLSSASSSHTPTPSTPPGSRSRLGSFRMRTVSWAKQCSSRIIGESKVRGLKGGPRRLCDIDATASAKHAVEWAKQSTVQAITDSKVRGLKGGPKKLSEIDAVKRLSEIDAKGTVEWAKQSAVQAIEDLSRSTSPAPDARPRLGSYRNGTVKWAKHSVVQAIGDSKVRGLKGGPRRLGEIDAMSTVEWAKQSAVQAIGDSKIRGLKGGPKTLRDIVGVPQKGRVADGCSDDDSTMAGSSDECTPRSGGLSPVASYADAPVTTIH